MDPSEYVLQAYQQIFSLPVEQTSLLGWNIPLPQFPFQLIKNLLKKTAEKLQKEPILLEVTAPCYIIGDLHGNIFDLLRVLIYTQPPPKVKIVFLGDYVDRGEFSVEVITLLFALYCKYPEHVILLRGNHEFSCVNETYGFQSEVQEQYHDNDIYLLSNTAFNSLPFAAVISNRVFAVHGGLSPELKSLSDITAIKKPVDQYYTTLISDLVWSDPSIERSEFFRSSRGTGVTYGETAARNFFSKTGLTNIVRGHQCVPLGIAKVFNSGVYTVFSCSNYADVGDNRCGILLLDENLKFHPYSLPPLSIPSRAQTKFSNGTSASGKTDSLALNLKLNDLHKTKIRSNSLKVKGEFHYCPDPSSSLSRSTDNLRKNTILHRNLPNKNGVSISVLPPLNEKE